MEISKDSFDVLPKEILQQIISYLDQRTVTKLRATNRLFRALLFKTDFEITSNDVDWSDVSNRLLKYYNTTLISLKINISHAKCDEIAESISKLSNLSTLKTGRLDLSPEQLLKLTDLVNLYEFDNACKAPLAPLLRWSNLTLLRCNPPHVIDFPFSELQALQRLELFWPDVDLSKNTNLTALLLRSPSPTIENLVKLRKLNMNFQPTNPFLRLFTDLENLEMDSSTRTDYTLESHVLQFINSKRLTKLWFQAAYQQLHYGDLTRLTTLQDLTIIEYGENDMHSDKINLSTLANLTCLRVQTSNISDFEISKLIKLKLLELEAAAVRSTLTEALSDLTKLEYIRLHNIATPNIETDLCFMKNLTDLIVELNDDSDYKFLEIAPIELFYNKALIRSSQFWSTVTKCTTLQSLRHGCESPSDNAIGSLTALSRLTQLSLRYKGNINEECFTALTTLRTLDFTKLSGASPVNRDWLLEHLTWLDEMYC